MVTTVITAGLAACEASLELFIDVQYRVRVLDDSYHGLAWQKLPC